MSGQLTVPEVADRLRDSLIAHLHLGHLHGGDRLPSIRTVAHELQEDQRKVARAYRMLEDEGLVEVRGRSGVVAAPIARLGNGVLEETAEWIAALMWDGWKRRVALTDLADLVRSRASSVRVRCALIDTCQDAIEAFSYELRQELGLEVVPLTLDTVRARSHDMEAGAASPLDEADFVVTTVFNVSAVRALAAPFNKPVCVLTVHPQFVTLVTKHLSERPLTVVCVDRSFADRIRLQYLDRTLGADRLHTVLADDAGAVARLDRSEPVLLTRAAHNRLGDTDLKLLAPHSPTLSPASALEIIRFVVRLHTTRMAPAPKP